MIAEQLKVCTKCKEQKAWSDYSLNDFGKPQSWCRDCARARALERYYKKKLSQADTNILEKVSEENL